jgi:hypothetical protein
MNRKAIAAVALSFALAVCCVPGGNRADETVDREVKEAKKEIVELSKLVEKGKDISTRAAALGKKVDDVESIMWCFKAKAKGGIGAGKTSADQNIEVKIIRLSMRPLTGEQLANEKADLIRIATISAAVAEVTTHYAPDRRVQHGAARKEWLKRTSEMKKFSLELLAAVKAGEPRKVKQAAAKLNDSCYPCHFVGRDQ